MRHVILTCRSHPDLRWGTKECAVNPGQPGDPAGYNGSRGLFFKGKPSGLGMYGDLSGLDCVMTEECSCPASDLVIAPEDPLVRKA